MQRHIVAILATSSVLLAAGSAAEEREFVRQYVYKASDDDSKNSARAKALAQLEIELLKEVGVYIESYLEVEEIASSESEQRYLREEIKATTAGIAKTEVESESWDGSTYSVRARVRLDPEDVSLRVAQALEARRGDREVARLTTLLEESNAELKARQAEVSLLRGEIDAKNASISRREAQIVTYRDEIERNRKKLEQLEREEVRILSERDRIAARIEEAGSLASQYAVVDMTHDEFRGLAGQPRTVYGARGGSRTCENHGTVVVAFRRYLLVGTIPTDQFRRRHGEDCDELLAELEKARDGR